jgi:hypothetical protein
LIHFKLKINLLKWEKSIEFTHTQTFFPESLLLNVCGRSPGLRLVVGLLIRLGEQWHESEQQAN